MNWFTRLFSQDKESSVANANKVAEKMPSTEAAGVVTVDLQCTSPISENVDILTFEQIKHLVPIRQLDEQALMALSHKVLTYAEGAIIFILKQPATCVYYLLEGEVTLRPDGDHSYIVLGDSTRAHLPINSGKLFGATAEANTEVKILVVAADLTGLWTAKNRDAIDCVELIDIELPEELNSQRFFHSFSNAYRENKLVLPSLPDVAVKLKEAIDNEGIGAKEVVDIIQVDAAMVAKLIQVANSSLYAPITPITNCQEAVARLGLTATRNLVTGIALKQLFLCKDKKLMGAMQRLWHRSLYVSSLSFVLAEENGIINQDDALLAGLISDIGVIPLLHFAEQYPDEYPDVEELELAMPYLRAPVGTLMLHTLGFPDELSRIPRHSEDWHYESSDDITLIDIVVLAKLHSYFGSKKSGSLPYINTIPAYSKLKNGKLNPDFSLHVLHKASQRIKDVMSVLA